MRIFCRALLPTHRKPAPTNLQASPQGRWNDDASKFATGLRPEVFRPGLSANPAPEVVVTRPRPRASDFGASTRNHFNIPFQASRPHTALIAQYMPNEPDNGLSANDEGIGPSSVNAFRASLLRFSHTNGLSPRKPQATESTTLKRSYSNSDNAGSPSNRRRITRPKSEAVPPSPKAKKILPYAPPETYAHLNPLQDNLKPHLESESAYQSHSLDHRSLLA